MPFKYYKNQSLSSLYSYIRQGTDIVIFEEEDGYYAYPVASASSFVCNIKWNGDRVYPVAKINSEEWISFMSKKEILEALKQITY